VTLVLFVFIHKKAKNYQAFVRKRNFSSTFLVFGFSESSSYSYLTSGFYERAYPMVEANLSAGASISSEAS
jgi:hypothetical protein